jgi:hypothetical protein
MLEATEVDRITKGDQDYWLVTFALTENGSTRTHVHLMPVETPEWRAAEYGIDPTDTATLLDIVLAEPMLTAEDWATGVHLHTAPDIDIARRDHVSRCAAVKWRHRLSTRRTDHPCRRISAESPMRSEAISLKRQLVERVRTNIAAAAVPAPDRIGVLRAALGVSRGERG